MRRNDYRIICDCQRHALRERTLWRRSVRAAKSTAQYVGRRGLALLVGLPLAFSFLDMPIEAMNLDFARAAWTSTMEPYTVPRAKVVRASTVTTTPVVSTAQQQLPIFTTRAVANGFLDQSKKRRRPSISISEAAKEEFFRTQVPFGPIIYREARRNNLPPELVAAIVSTESDFRPHLISRKNAQGLMQIMPSTGKLLGVSDPFSPEENIAAGTRYLRYLFKRFGDEKIVLAAYNAGEGNVAKFGGIPPFPETQNYLLRVSARTRNYEEKMRLSVR